MRNNNNKKSRFFLGGLFAINSCDSFLATSTMFPSSSYFDVDRIFGMVLSSLLRFYCKTTAEIPGFEQISCCIHIACFLFRSLAGLDFRRKLNLHLMHVVPVLIYTVQRQQQSMSRKENIVLAANGFGGSYHTIS